MVLALIFVGFLAISKNCYMNAAQPKQLEGVVTKIENRCTSQPIGLATQPSGLIRQLDLQVIKGAHLC